MTASLVAIPLLAFSILVSTLGDCVPDEPCSSGLFWWLFIPSMMIAGIAGFSVRWIINWVARRLSSAKQP